ncbi:unnamed protein product, partial [Ectocarpus sp. 6 AP-2014]
MHGGAGGTWGRRLFTTRPGVLPHHRGLCHPSKLPLTNRHRFAPLNSFHWRSKQNPGGCPLPFPSKTYQRPRRCFGRLKNTRGPQQNYELHAQGGGGTQLKQNFRRGFCTDDRIDGVWRHLYI